MANLNTEKDNLPLDRLERNIISFKGLLNILNSTSFKTDLAGELFSKSFNIFNDDILRDTINSAPTTATFSSTRTWVVDSSQSDENEKVYKGSFSESSDSEGDNPNVEKIIVPLTKVSNTTDQLYFAYVPEPGEFSTTYGDPSTFAYFSANIKEGILSQLAQPENKAKILKNFISPFQFGLGFQAEVRQSTSDYTGPDMGFSGQIQPVENNSVGSTADSNKR